MLIIIVVLLITTYFPNTGLSSLNGNDNKQPVLGIFYDMEFKICAKCKIELKKECFYPSLMSKSKLSSYCKGCCSNAYRVKKEKVPYKRVEIDENEVWKPINYGIVWDNYIINTKGIVVFLGGAKYNKNGFKIIKREKVLHITYRKGYATINAKIEGIGTRFFVHRLVASTFIPNPDNKPQVNHINGDRGDNNLSNLEWVTHQENMVHGHYLLKNKRAANKAIIQYSLSGDFIKKWRGINDAYKGLGLKGNRGIGLALQNKLKKAHGYIWKYEVT